MAVRDVAVAHAERRAGIARRAAAEAVRLWRRVDVGSIASSWERTLPALLGIVGTSQAVAAASAGVYADDLVDEYGLPDRSVGRISTRAFAGIASDGRPLDTLLNRPAITALTQIARGATVERGMAAGAFTVDMIVRTQVADAGRTATGVAITARPELTGYVRMIVGGTCPRCLVLAGVRYRWNAGFERHPRCDCIHVPVAEDVPGDVRTDPQAHFDALDEAEQDELLGPAGAEAVRSGADLNQVVNARRGMHTAGGQQVTGVGATRRGLAGKRLGAPSGGRATRLMPEQIYLDADGDRAEAIRLLKLHGYIV